MFHADRHIIISRNGERQTVVESMNYIYLFMKKYSAGDSSGVLAVDSLKNLTFKFKLYPI